MSQDIELYDYRPITERAPLSWPEGKRVAFYVGLNIEHFYVDLPGTATYEGTTALTPDSLNYGWRDYGPRVGIWRQIKVFDKHGIKASALLNSDVAARYPQIIDAGVQRGWTWLGHGASNSHLFTALDRDVEQGQIREVLQTIERATGAKVRGWMGPGLIETFNTPELLAAEGVEYVLDWTNDDQPYPTNVPGLLSLPYSVELNDIGIFVSKGLTGPDFVRMVRDQVDQLAEDAADGSGRVLALALHPFITGQAFRTRYLDEALEYVVNHPAVWSTTSDAIADHYLAVPRG
ncbi:polysaccharide deacetylase family protein [Catenulispora sp. NL8]|uniref:Polysaccharide deacetylase family protein n=1 Tax=Catenulispora pinistramenti TaxID=2705254 RepID=A0ABS5KUL3_9ACTN|nr:polysaccharide deacetylase family protein [Catenulispora pinistramenti]MBS2549690.1 polysaccharide deacetylase family protein [Catenulispora pinistramenti]